MNQTSCYLADLRRFKKRQFYVGQVDVVKYLISHPGIILDEAGEQDRFGQHCIMLHSTAARK